MDPLVPQSGTQPANISSPTEARSHARAGEQREFGRGRGESAARFGRCRSICFVAGIVAIASAGTAHAHLSMIRQGDESAGSREAGDRFGAAVAAGDFNGDGFDDVATGAPNEAIGSSADAGSVTISWGSPFGVTHEDAEFITALTLGETLHAEAEFGYALVAGDFNNDGRDDLIIGAPGDQVGLSAHAGRIYALRGSATGLSLAATFTQFHAGESSEANDRFGSSIAVGNWNDDAYLDLAVGVPGEDSNAGMVATFNGDGVFLAGDDSYRASTFGIANTAGNLFGFALGAGNFVGNSADDLAIGCPGRTVSFNNSAGCVFIMRGSSSGLAGYAPHPDASYLDALQPGGIFGSALAVGRFFGGSHDALAIGEPGRNISTSQATGRVVVIKGGTLGLGTAMRVQQTFCGGTEGDNDFFGNNLAAGFFDSGSTYEELAVGAIGEGGATGAPSSGAVYILYGGSSGPNGTHGWAAFDQGALNEWRQSNDRLGYALAFGKFDDSNKGALLVGAPGNDIDTGIVHLIAPWRQTYGLQCQHSVVTDCEGNLVFTQKPFDQVWIASTTKTMTVLLAAERSRLSSGHPDYVDLDWEYTVPNWVYWDIPGSQVPLITGETMTLRELMWTCMFMSGNDAAYAIADLCEGSNGPDDSVPLFIDNMNARAAALGMDGTHFHNPAGLDNEPVGPELGEHYSTPHDMMLLARAAMEDDIVREIVGSSSFTMTRRWSDDTEEDWEFFNIFGGVLANAIEPMNGIKGGCTPRAQGTGLFSAGVPGGDALVTTFLTPAVDPNNYTPDAAHLMELGAAECEYELTFQESPLQSMYLGEFLTCQECIEGRALELDFGPPGDLVFDLFDLVGNGINARLEMLHTTEFYFRNDESVQFGIGPFQERSTISIRNMSTLQAEILFVPSAGGTAIPFTIPAQSAVTVPAFTSPTPLSQYTATITALGARPAHLSVETTYAFDIETAGLRADTPAFQATPLRDSSLINDVMQVRVVGQDPVAGGKILMVAHAPGTTVDVTPDEIAPTEALLSDLAAGPNPFAGETTLRFTLQRPAAVGAQIFDAQGRLVRAVDERPLTAGSWSLSWNGRDAAGTESPAGVYFYRVSVDGEEVGSGKLVRVE